MKLISKTTLIYLVLFLCALTAAGLLISDQFQKLSDRHVEHYFSRKEKMVLYRLEKGYDVSKINTNFGRVVVKNIGSVYPENRQAIYRDSIVVENGEQLNIIDKTTFRQVGNQVYQINILRDVTEYRELKEGVFHTLMWVFMSLVLVLILANYIIAGWLWQPFYKVLSQIRGFSFDRGKRIELKATTTKEFKELNSFYAQMVDKINEDYKNLKEFTENTAHEIQTPIAIIKAKIESLLCIENIDEHVLVQLSTISDSASKLSRMSRTLNLLTKIENQEFVSKDRINVKAFVENLMFNFKEIADLKNISVVKELDEQTFLDIDPYIFDILLSNLLKNAIRYNEENGSLKIICQSNRIEISNSGEALNFDESKLFDRFSNSQRVNNSLGLGLAIAKKICDINDLKLNYFYREKLHVFQVCWN